jgi:hypothetical protein
MSIDDDLGEDALFTHLVTLTLHHGLLSALLATVRSPASGQGERTVVRETRHALAGHERHGGIHDRATADTAASPRARGAAGIDH